MTEGSPEVRRIFEALAAVRVRSAVPEERELHDAVAAALTAAGIDYIHEAVIAPRCRVDFLCGPVVLEIKKGKVPRARLLAQCGRYCAPDCVQALICIAPRSLSLPASIGGKRVYTYSVNRLWGVALPV